jgi:hypothetical protein
LNIFSKIAEQRIRDAIEKGELEDLAGSGRPIRFEDETWIPEDLRAAYRVLKNAGCIPAEMELRKEVLSLGQLIQTLDDDRERMKKIRELNFKLMKLGEMRKRPVTLDKLPEYEEKIFRKITEKS